jgi:hypothetical protein
MTNQQNTEGGREKKKKSLCQRSRSLFVSNPALVGIIKPRYLEVRHFLFFFLFLFHFLSNLCKMDTISTERKVEIASGFLLASPPGEVNDVFNGRKKKEGKKRCLAGMLLTRPLFTL